MQDLIDMTKAELAAIIGGMTASQIKKMSHADLVQMAGEKAAPKAPTQGEVIASLTDLEKCVVVAYLSNGIEGNPMPSPARSITSGLTVTGTSFLATA